MTLSAAQLYDRAVAHSNAGRLAAARRHLSAALARAPDLDLAARIDGTLAYLDAESTDPGAALARIRAAAAAPGISGRTRAVLLGQAGLVAMRRGETDAALRDLGRAIARLRDDPPRLGQLALNRGDVHLQRGDLRRAVDDFVTARAAFAAAGQPIDEAKARHNLGYTALLEGDLIRAIREMDAAREVLGEVSPVLPATGDADRATALLAAGMPGEASALLAAAIRRSGRSALRQQQAEAELLLARTLVHSDPGRAAGIAERAARRFRVRGAEAWAVRADGWALSAAVRAGRRGLEERLVSTSARLRDAGFHEDATRLDLDAIGASIAGGAAHAGAELRRIAPGRRAPVPLRMLAWQVRAALAAAEGDPRAVLRLAATGVDELGAAQASLGSVDLQSSLLLHARPLLERGLRTALELGRPEVLLEWTERARDVVARVQPLEPADDPGTAADLAEVRRLRAFGGDAARERALLERLRARSWHERGSGAVRSRAGLGALQARLAAVGAVAVALCRVDGRLAAVVVTGDGARIVQLGGSARTDALLAGLRADLELAAAAPSGPIATSVAAALAARLAAVDAVLIAPLHLPDAAVVLSVPGALSGVPWSLLPGLAGRPVTVPTSLAAWASGPHRAPLRSAGFVAGPRVPRAVEEVALAAAAWPSAAVLSGADAAVERVMRLAGEVDVLHVAAHGRHHAEQPLFSGVELADGAWFGYDVARLARVPEVVVLSSCEVGRSSLTWGEETTGMARAWLQAGARCVIASAASVDDDLACALVPEVHRRLAAGESPARALAGGRSSFVCFGDGVG